MKKYIKSMEAARRLACKIQSQEKGYSNDLETARESERAEELRAEGKAARKSKDIGYGGTVYGSEEERAAMIADGCHPDSFDCDGADRDL